MTVLSRPISEMGYYHVILRGNGKQIIFEERSDNIHFLQNLKQYSTENKIVINAFCLMENHVHLLVYDGERNLSLFMKRLAGNYAIWFNRKYQRSGHLFEGRYVSVPVESEDRLCTVFRYILNNPQKAHICAAPDYPWSSYKSYRNPFSFVDTSVFEKLLGSFEEYAAYIAAKYEDEDPYDWVRTRDDAWAASVIRKTLGTEGGKIRSFDFETRNSAIRLLKEKGLSVRQIERLTGISKSVIQRV